MLSFAPRWGRLRARSAVTVDALLAVAAVTGTLILILHGGSNLSHQGPGTLDGTSVTLAGLNSVPLLWWRRSPFGVFVLTGVANALLAVLAYPIGLPLGPAIALYLVVMNREDREPRVGTVALAGVGLFGVYLGAAAAKESVFPGVELLHGGLAWAVAWFAGGQTRLRRLQIAELKREAERERLLAAAEERARIARDLHDSAGHAVNVIAVRAGAARMRHHRDPDRSLAALEAIEALARQTVDEIDRLVGALRQHDDPDDGQVDSPPGLASLNTLVAQQHAAGLEVTVHTQGTPRPLARTADQAAYRILQEALTNASRHGNGTVRVDIDFGESVADFTVTNRAGTASPARPGGGHGLVGMRERATLVQGELEVDRSHRTFRLHARIPYGGRSS